MTPKPVDKTGASPNSSMGKSRFTLMRKFVGANQFTDPGESRDQMNTRMGELRTAANNIQDSSAHKAIQYYSEMVALGLECGHGPAERAQVSE